MILPSAKWCFFCCWSVFLGIGLKGLFMPTALASTKVTSLRSSGSFERQPSSGRAYGASAGWFRYADLVRFIKTQYSGTIK
jgi:hypothetical protein